MRTSWVKIGQFLDTHRWYKKVCTACFRGSIERVKFKQGKKNRVFTFCNFWGFFMFLDNMAHTSDIISSTLVLSPNTQHTCTHSRSHTYTHTDIWKMNLSLDLKIDALGSIANRIQAQEAVFLGHSGWDLEVRQVVHLVLLFSALDSWALMVLGSHQRSRCWLEIPLWPEGTLCLTKTGEKRSRLLYLLGTVPLFSLKKYAVRFWLSQYSSS